MKYLFRSSIFYIFSLLLFFSDIFLLGFFEQQVISLLLCFYAYILSHKSNFKLFVFILFLLSCNSFILNGKFWLPLTYILPLSILSIEAKSFFNKTFWVPYFFVVSNIFLQEVLIQQIRISYLFFITKICVSIVVVLVFEKTFSQR